eukprot:CAMPEP_0177593990 /NCGR_PEP_ID=MMETSP0419_2-20121207/9516_1 /TAXON_ID=582737 /ORGANISM="Tetraselmis sp., Strain GSL018" /LENGTH=35 /DNA_ID= /DNA_START= /DNA_END= /DNA_ORIENTATION=
MRIHVELEHAVLFNHSPQLVIFRKNQISPVSMEVN